MVTVTGTSFDEPAGTSVYESPSTAIATVVPPTVTVDPSGIQNRPSPSVAAVTISVLSSTTGSTGCRPSSSRSLRRSARMTPRSSSRGTTGAPATFTVTSALALSGTTSPAAVVTDPLNDTAADDAG